MLRLSESAKRANRYLMDELWAAIARIAAFAPKRKDLPSPTVHVMDLLLEDLKRAKAQRAMFEKQAEQAFRRYKELKEAEFDACRRIAEAKAALLARAEA